MRLLRHRLATCLPFLLLLATGSLLATVAPAQPLSQAAVPDPLKPWVPWVLDGAEDRLCPAVEQTAVCLWPGRLALDARADGARFSLEAFADHDLELPLPGGERSWPQGVLLDGRPAAVVARVGRPVLRLTAGSHRLAGRFAWDRLPDSLPVPPAVAIVDLSVEGRGVALPRREPDGLLLLRAAGAAAGAGENLQLKVFRQVRDGIPLWVETRVAFEVSGRAREVSLTGALLEGAAPVAVFGELPARLDADGTLRVQVRAGQFTVKVLARLPGRPESLGLPETAAPWPAEEIWVFAPAERLRQVELGGAPGIDPSRTDLPDEWRRFPAFLMERPVRLTLKELRRGEPEAAPDQIQLARRLWLDVGGGGYSVRDVFSGQLGRTSRLDLLPPGELGRVAVDGAGQLVTRDPVTGAPGVEVRRAALALEADSRLARSGRLPAVGWGVNIQSLRAELALPPGWRLLATAGVDRSPGSWTAGWNLFGFFFVLLVALAAGKLLGRTWGALALVTLVLLHGEADAPQAVWLWLLAALAVARVAPAGLLRTLARLAGAGGLLALVLILVPFSIAQIRSGLFPSAAAPAWPALLRDRVGGGVEGGVPGGVLGGVVGGLPAAPPPVEAPQAEEAQRVGKLEAETKVAGEIQPQNVPRSRYEANVLSLRKKAYEQDPHALIQTGPGVPSWAWASYPLLWSGPVAKDQTMRLVLLSPGVNLLLALLRVGLTFALALRLLAEDSPGAAARLRFGGGMDGAGLAGALALATLLAAPGPAGADDTGGFIPSPQMLEELKQRLTRPPACAPHCVTTASLHLEVAGAELRFAAEVNAAAAAAWPLPGPAANWVPRAVGVDGADVGDHLARLPDGFLYLRLPPGAHRVSLAGPLPPTDSLTLQFRERPRRATASAPGWQVDGIREDGGADDSVQLSRKLAVGAVGGAAAGGGYQPWLEVTRSFEIGVSWNVTTLIRRVSPLGTPLVVKVPLLKGMLVTDGDRQVKDGEVLVTLGRDQAEASWSATLPPAEGETVRLQAPTGKPWSEVWVLNCGPVWECAAEGPPPVARWRDGTLAPEFRPWPGETLALTFRRPAGVEGRTLTLDSASLRLSPGIRLEDATLEVRVRTSRPGPLEIALPAEAEIQELKVAGADRPVRAAEGRLKVTVEAGDQAVHVAWRQAGGLGLLHRAPPVSLGQPAVNVSLAMRLPDERWLLLTGGPSWGPHVLFWGYLVLVLIAAAVLSRLPGSPLAGWEWLLLALGLTQIPALGAVLVAGWFLAFAWRRDRVLERAALHDLMQLGLVLWTLLALGFLYAAVHQGLLLRPDMQVEGGGSSQTLLQWYADRTGGALPRPWALSAPLWTYKVLMLAWSLWLAAGLVRWLPWTWTSFSSAGLWRPLRGPKVVAPSEPPPQA